MFDPERVDDGNRVTPCPRSTAAEPSVGSFFLARFNQLETDRCCPEAKGLGRRAPRAGVSFVTPPPKLQCPTTAPATPIAERCWERFGGGTKPPFEELHRPRDVDVWVRSLALKEAE